MRNIAVINYKDDFDISETIIPWFVNAEINVFTTLALADANIERYKNFENVKVRILADEIDNMARARNYVIKTLKAEKTGFLHLIESSTLIKQSPDKFMIDIENMMTVLDMNSWLNCSCDRLNYLYSKFNPRFYLYIDKPEYAKFNIDCIIFGSHSNTQWTVYNLDKAEDFELYMPEDYTVPMFYIIEYLANRRNNRKPGQLYYMNQYLTVQSEIGVFEAREAKSEQSQTEFQKTLEAEDKIFKGKNINFAPDNNIDNILEDVYNKFNSKL